MIDTRSENVTIFVNNNVKCTYYPSTRNTILENMNTLEYIVLNLDEWSKVHEFLMAMAKR